MALEFQLNLPDPSTAEVDCVVVGVYADASLSPAAQALDSASGGRIAALAARGDVSGKTGRTTLLQDLPGVKSPRVLTVGLGERGKFAVPQFLKAIADGVRALRTGPVKNALLTLTELPVKGRDLAWNLRQAVITADHAAYEYTATRSKAAEVTLASVTFAADAALQPELQRGIAVAAGVQLARELGNLPPNICNPAYLATQAEGIATQFDNVVCEVLEREQMELLGMGSLLAVA
ncbi:MAG: M17 family peptidase N-terminal domain-containing protein, partial [Arenimonas sp.]